jgi:hypothetical protein
MVAWLLPDDSLKKKHDANRERQQRLRQRKKAEAGMANAIEQVAPTTLPIDGESGHVIYILMHQLVSLRLLDCFPTVMPSLCCI